MDNNQMKVDSYGRLIHVPEYPEAPEPRTAEEVWARAERVKKLEDEIERAKTHIYNLRERVKILEITPLVPPPSENWRTLSESLRELWDKVDDLQLANVEILSKLSDQITLQQMPLQSTPCPLTERVKALEDRADQFQVANYEITRSLSRIMPDHTNWTTQTKWVEEELEAIKNMPSERVCSSCKWGTENPNNKMKVDCHNQPYYNVNPHNYWCKEWCEK